MSNASSAMILAPRYMPNSHMASATRPASVIRPSICCPSRSILSTVRGEFDKRGSQLFDGIEASHPQEVLLEGSDEAFCDAVALGLSHEGGRSFDSQAFDLVLEIAGHVVGAMIVTQLQSMRHAGRDGSEAPMHPLAYRLQRLEAISRTRGMNSDDFRIGVFHGNEDIGATFPDRHRLRHVGSPHLIDLVGDDRSIVRLGLGTSHPMRREQAVLAHHPSYTAGAHANASPAQSPIT